MTDSHCYFFKFKEKTMRLWKLLISLPSGCFIHLSKIRSEHCKDWLSPAVTSAHTLL